MPIDYKVVLEKRKAEKKAAALKPSWAMLILNFHQTKN